MYIFDECSANLILKLGTLHLKLDQFIWDMSIQQLVMLIGYLESPATGRAKRWASQYSKLHVCLGVGVSVC